MNAPTASERRFRDLMNALADGDPGAAEEIVQQYTADLIAVARRRIGAKLGKRIDPEDVVQSAYRSFFVRMERGEYELGDGGELWKLLTTITLNKIRRHGKFHNAQRRDVRQEQSDGGEHSPWDRAAPDPQPGPDEAAMLIDEVETLLASLSAEDRQVVQLRLQGWSSVEIARETGRGERAIRRALQRITQNLQQTQQADSVA